MALEGAGAVVGDGPGQEVELDVRVLHAGAAADVAVGFKLVGGAQAPFQEQPVGTDPGFRQGSEPAVQGDLLRALLLHPDFQMILQVLAHAGQIVHHFDAVFLKVVRRTDAGQHQQLG